MILFISPSVHLSLLRGFYPSGSLIKMLHTGLIAHMHATWLIHLILHELIILTVPSEEYKLWNYSLCNSAQPPGVSLNFLRSKYTPQQPILLLLILLHTLPQGSKQASKQANKQTNKQTNNKMVKWRNHLMNLNLCMFLGFFDKLIPPTFTQCVMWGLIVQFFPHKENITLIPNNHDFNACKGPGGKATWICNLWTTYDFPNILLNNKLVKQRKCIWMSKDMADITNKSVPAL